MAVVLSLQPSLGASVRVAISNWWQRGTIAKLSLEERERLYHELWELWELRPSEERNCPQHQVLGVQRPLYPAFESVKIELDETNQQQLLSIRTIDCCIGDENLAGGHSVMPRDYAVVRGCWSEICEVPLTSVA